jgi:hypothetical protein
LILCERLFIADYAVFSQKLLFIRDLDQ